MRIVAGRFKGRVLFAPDGHATRPTADRVRESLFNILAHGDYDIEGARVADVFAGSGTLGFEALSRGAAHVTFFENEGEACAIIAANARKLGVHEHIEIIRIDATKPPKAKLPCDLLLLDPPYRARLGETALPMLLKQGWIAPHATLVVELGAAEPFASPLKDWAIEDERRYGAARLVFLRKAA